jgi:hypothetical protein
VAALPQCTRTQSAIRAHATCSPTTPTSREHLSTPHEYRRMPSSRFAPTPEDFPRHINKQPLRAHDWHSIPCVKPTVHAGGFSTDQSRQPLARSSSQQPDRAAGASARVHLHFCHASRTRPGRLAAFGSLTVRGCRYVPLSMRDFYATVKLGYICVT